MDGKETKNTVIFDIDGTLANIEHRLHYIKKGVMEIGDTVKERNYHWYGKIAHTHPDGKIDVTVLDVEHQKHPDAKEYASEHRTTLYSQRADFKKISHMGDFEKACVEDVLKVDVKKLLDLMKMNNRIVLCSGRPETLRDKTVIWLARNGIGPCVSGRTGKNQIYDKLYMRPSGSNEKDYLVKRKLLDEILSDGFNPWCAVDDRQQVVDMWREAGLLCLQVAEGNF